MDRTVEQRPRQSGKWTEILSRLDQVSGIVVCTEELAARVRVDRPDRDVRVDPDYGGAIRVFTFDTLPLHLYTKAERRRAQCG